MLDNIIIILQIGVLLFDLCYIFIYKKHMDIMFIPRAIVYFLNNNIIYTVFCIIISLVIYMKWEEYNTYGNTLIKKVIPILSYVLVNLVVYFMYSNIWQIILMIDIMFFIYVLWLIDDTKKYNASLFFAYMIMIAYNVKYGFYILAIDYCIFMVMHFVKYKNIII